MERVAAKIVVAGAAGAGKTTFVGAASEITPLTTDVALGVPGAVARDSAGHGGAADGAPAAGSATTTVGLDYGRVTVEGPLALHLFGLPGAPRAGLGGDVVARGCAGVVVVVDGRRPHGGGPALDRARRLGVPYVVASNRFEGARPSSAAALHAVLGLDPDVPVVSCDARCRHSVRACLAVLGGSLRTRLQAGPAGAAGRTARPAPYPGPVPPPGPGPSPSPSPHWSPVSELSAAARNVGWLVDRLPAATEGVLHAAVVSSDGVLLARSSGLDPSSADQLAAVVASMVGLAQGTDRCFSGDGLHRMFLEFGRGWLMATPIGADASLGMVTRGDCDLASVSDRVHHTAELTAEVMSPTVRGELARLITV